MLPTDFPHTAPEGYHYETTPAKQNYTAIWLCHHREYIYHDTPIRTIWGYHGGKAQCYHAPISATKRGNKVDLRDTTPYTAMQLLKTTMDTAETVTLAAQQGPNPLIITTVQTKDMKTEFSDFVATQDARNTIQLNVRKYTMMLCDALVDNFKTSHPNSDPYKFYIEEGRKYHKIVMETESQSKSVHAFVDKKNGDVYKAASFKAPAKGVRFNLCIISDREHLLENADWAGGYLYMR